MSEFKNLPSGWKVVRLGDVLKIGSGKDYKHLKSGNIPVYGTGGYMLSVNDFLYDGESVCIGRKGTIDKPIYLNCKFWTVDTLFYTYGFKNSFPKFIYYVFLAIDWKKYNEASGVPSLSKNTVYGIAIRIPPLDEQKKIAEILSTWDEAINLTINLIKNKKQFKKALMQNLLTAKIRFPEFQDEWEETKLGEICEIKKGEQLNKNILSNDVGFPVINGGIEPSGYTQKWNTKENTITISEGGNSCGYVNLLKEKFWSGGHCYTLLNLKIDKNFLYQYLKYKQDDIMKLRVGSGLPNIQKNTIENFYIVEPLLKEQQKIAEVLTACDDEINLLNLKLEILKKQKQGLMQKLLSAKVRVKGGKNVKMGD